MKTIGTLIYMVFFVLLISCEKEPDLSFGFDSPIDKNSKGLVIADISHYVQHINLDGFISVTEGEVEVYLLNPDGVTVYSKTLIAPIELNISETFEAKSGYWKLKYISSAGVGEINLHLHKL